MIPIIASIPYQCHTTRQMRKRDVIRTVISGNLNCSAMGPSGAHCKDFRSFVCENLTFPPSVVGSSDYSKWHTCGGFKPMHIIRNIVWIGIGLAVCTVNPFLTCRFGTSLRRQRYRLVCGLVVVPINTTSGAHVIKSSIRSRLSRGLG